MKETDYPKIIVKADKLPAIRRRHPWIFSRGIQTKPDVKDGEIVKVFSPKGEYLATGHYHDSSIAVRILSYNDQPINQDFWNTALATCLNRRRALGLPSDQTTAYRLVHGEGDNLSGLIIDIYTDVAVIQCHSVGMHRSLSLIVQALKHLFSDDIIIYDKSSNALPSEYSSHHSDGFLQGERPSVQIKENGHHFFIDLIEGQKTGFFLDQRENRQLLSSYSLDKQILNLYSYTGGFSIYALNAGAANVSSVDASSKAIKTLEENLTLNKIDPKRHQSIIGDVKKILLEVPDNIYDIIVVDPPAFAKSQYKSHNAVQAYKRINAMAISKVKSGGLIFTFSCSQVIEQILFQNTITAAAIESGRDARIIHILSQAPDHPVSIFHPEGKYLKGLVLQVE
ncbi:MAG: class I SAM-dependent rRNA methyltransferase [Saprospiraceae bacterium]|nr:class I SAM-dependent rRNA methyltransferase [Saprospiraceae bacterium]